MSFKDKKVFITELVFRLNLEFTSEDKEQIAKLIKSYFRKRTNIINSSIENLAGGLLWVYSRINFLFQDNESWSQQRIAGMLGIKPKTVSNIANKIMDALRIDCFDQRFARKEIAEKDPRNDFFMTKSGFILHKDDIKNIIINNGLKEWHDNINKLNEKRENMLDENSTVRKKASDDKGSNIKNKKLTEFFR